MAELIPAVICLFLVIPCQARIITVDDDGYADFNNIQAAINDSNDGDTILVADGTYTGDGNRDINFLGKAITVRSTDPNDSAVVGATVIDCQGSPGQFYRGFLFDSGEDSNTVLEGLTITGGFAVNLSGGISCVNESNPTIRNCIIQENVGYPGGGIVCFGSSPMFTNCIIRDNNSFGDGGGLGCFDGSDPQITNCTITGNSAFASGDGIYCFDSSPTITNCILLGNTPAEVYVYSGTPVVTYSDVQGGWPGLGNIDSDPCFADSNNGDYHLKSQAGRFDANSQSWVQDEATSPCIDAGNPGCPLGDEPAPNGNRRNMGAYSGTAEASKSPANWRSIADMTNDWIVDSNDLKVFVDYWLQTGECIPSDLNRSQFVDFSDFAIFARQQPKNNYILLEIYSDGWGNLLETTTMEEEGQITILVYEEEPYSYPPARYYVYASRDGYYTEIYNCEAFGLPPNNFITVDVDLDPIVTGKFNGVIFMNQWFFSDYYLGNTDVNVVDGNIVVTQFQTDQQGRFAIEIEPGNYYFEFISDWQEYHLEPVSIGGEYEDFFFPYLSPVWKPNIYLYPEETIELDVDIVFPHGGRITTSVPDYNDGWHITVEPSGIIDGQFECLFYESLQPDYGQYTAGWVVIREQLEGFFRNNMGQTGFNQKEIDDFIEYWIPILTEYPYYAIYPQYRGELEEMIKLEFSAQPESLIRLIYSVRGLEDNNLNIEEPLIPPFTRDGFTVTEWGVILK